MRFSLLIFTLLATISATAQENLPMLSAKYNQGFPYNISCPDLSPTGCGPTAIAEILNFYKQPAHGYGEAKFIISLDTINVNMETLKFDWANILDSYTDGNYTESQAKSIADLMYACGVAMRVSYGPSTSVTNYAWMLYGLQHYLHISPESRYLHRKHYSTAEWLEIMNNQLAEGHPIFYRGSWFFGNERSDHMFAIDGINYKGNYHVNFGHGGKDDKFCDINIINQTGTYPGGRGVCYNASQAMVINCYPTPDFTSYPVQTSVSEEAIILNNDICMQNTEVALGEAFTLSCRLRNCSMDKTSITFGWALIRDGKVLDILGQGKYSLSPGYTFKEASHRTVKLPKNLTDGDYILTLYSKSNLEDEWKEVWRDAATEVNVRVHDGIATVTIPSNHRLDPRLFLAEPIYEVDNEFSTVPGRTFALTINNNTINNFEHKVRLEITAGGDEYVYETILPVYSQTSIPFRILVPSYQADMGNKNVTSVRAYYYYDLENEYIEMTTGSTSTMAEIGTPNMHGDVYVYDIFGTMLKMVKANEVSYDYSNILSDLPHGMYIIKEGERIRKFVK